MNFSELIIKRYSVRSYKNTMIEEEKLQKILNAARLAPSAVNFQPWHFIVVQDKTNRKALNEIYSRDWIKSAPIVIIICADHAQSWKRKNDGKDFADVDIAIAIDHMSLQATELGLGTCWVCNFDVQKCKELLNISGQIEPIALLPLGYPNSTAPIKQRKSMSDIVHWEKF